MYTKRKSRICKINRQKANGFLSVFYDCEASGLCTRSVVYLYTLCVYRYGAVSRRPGKCREAAKILLRQQQGYPPQAAGKPRSGALLRGLQNLETPLHAQRAAPTGACFPCNGKFPKGRRDVTFCGVQKVTQKARGTPSCDLGSNCRSIWCFG